MFQNAVQKNYSVLLVKNFHCSSKTKVNRRKGVAFKRAPIYCWFSFIKWLYFGQVVAQIIVDTSQGIKTLLFDKTARIA